MHASVLLGLLLVGASYAIRYDGYYLFEVGPINQQAADQLLTYRTYEGERKVVFINDEVMANGKNVQLVVHPSLVNSFMEDMTAHGIQYVIHQTNFQSVLDEEHADNVIARAAALEEASRTGKAATPNWFMTFDEMMSWVSQIAGEHSDASTFAVGNSHEGRSMIGLAINAGTSLPIIFIDAGIHPREWTASQSTCWIIHTLLTSSDSSVQSLRSSYRWYIAPSINADGHVFTHGSDRLWRKNRAPNSGAPLCPGTDLNRNWDFEFGGAGTSTEPCSDVYHGGTAFSQVETQNARDLINSLASSMALYIGNHAYSEYWLVPWGGRTAKPSDYNDLIGAANAAVNAIRSLNGNVWIAGTPPDILYPATGGAFDWVKESAGVKYAYSPELRPPNGTPNGFVIPASMIPDAGTETWVAIAAQVNHIAASGKK